jgi:hypothetical protein
MQKFFFFDYLLELMGAPTGFKKIIFIQRRQLTLASKKTVVISTGISKFERSGRNELHIYIA